MRLTTEITISLFAVVLALFGVFLAISPAEGSIPPKPETKASICDNYSRSKACCEYITSSYTHRMDQWAEILQRGLLQNPELDHKTQSCIMNANLIDDIDREVLNVCTAKPDSNFETVVIDALEKHLAPCGVTIER